MRGGGGGVGLKRRMLPEPTACGRPPTKYTVDCERLSCEKAYNALVRCVCVCLCVVSLDARKTTIHNKKELRVC